jgi:hypothetical protein
MKTTSDFLFLPLVLIYVLVGFAPFVIAQENKDMDKVLILANKVSEDLSCIKCLVEELRYAAIDQVACFDCTPLCKETQNETK